MSLTASIAHMVEAIGETGYVNHFWKGSFRLSYTLKMCGVGQGLELFGLAGRVTRANSASH